MGPWALCATSASSPCTSPTRSLCRRRGTKWPERQTCTRRWSGCVRAGAGGWSTGSAGTRGRGRRWARRRPTAALRWRGQGAGLGTRACWTAPAAAASALPLRRHVAACRSCLPGIVLVLVLMLVPVVAPGPRSIPVQGADSRTLFCYPRVQ